MDPESYPATLEGYYSTNDHVKRHDDQVVGKDNKGQHMSEINIQFFRKLRNYLSHTRPGYWDRVLRKNLFSTGAAIYTNIFKNEDLSFIYLWCNNLKKDIWNNGAGFDISAVDWLGKNRQKIFGINKYGYNISFEKGA